MRGVVTRGVARWSRRTGAAAILALACLLGMVATASARPAASATTETLYAYADGTSTAAACPESPGGVAGCSLATALGDVSSSEATTIELATPGDNQADDYVGNWSVTPDASYPLTIVPAPGLDAAPVLTNGINDTGAPACTTSTCANAVLTITGPGDVAIAGLSFADAQNLNGNNARNGAGTGNGDGGAIDNGEYGGEGADLTVSGDAFSGDVASYCGGAICNAPRGIGTLTVEGSSFSDDAATDDGGAIDNGDDEGSGTAQVIDSSFADDTALDGGAIDNGDTDGTGTVKVVGSSFADNTAGDGGAVDNGDDEGSGTLEISDATFVDNTASHAGSAIDDDGATRSSGDLQVTDSTFAASSASQGSIIVGAIQDTQVFLAADIFDGSCNQENPATWTDGGDNVGTDTSCEGTDGGTPPASDSAALTPSELGPLASNGGPTQTVALESGNPAIGLVPQGTTVNDSTTGATIALCPVTDQRGFASGSGMACDAGAVQQTLGLSAPTNLGPQDDVAYAGSVAASGGSGSYTYALGAGTLPTGLSLDPSTGAISGTSSELGSFPVTLSAGDGDGDSGSVSFTLVVAATPLSVAPSSLPGGTAGTAYDQSLSASGDTAPYSYSVVAGALPTGLSLSTAGVISGTPSSAGSFNFTVRAADASTGQNAPVTGSTAYTVTIAAAPATAPAPTPTVAPAPAPTAAPSPAPVSPSAPAVPVVHGSVRPGIAGPSYELSAGASSVSGSRIVAYRWTLGTETIGDHETISHRFPRDGSYTVSLTVTAADGQSATSHVSVQVRTRTITLTRTLYFGASRADLSRSQAAALNGLRDYFGAADSATIVGYCSATETSDSRALDQLSLDRATAVLAQLRGGHTAAPAHLGVTGRGGRDFVASNRTAAGRAANQRVTLTIVYAKPLS